MGMKMLELRNISYAVPGEALKSSETKEIIRNVSLTIKPNKFVTITGPNGGGKSTLAKIIVGIEKPTSGRIFFEGKDITDWSITQRAKEGIGFAFQQPVRFKGITVKDLIRLATGESISTQRACEYLSEVGLCARDYIDREVNASLSGGELKRIEIATMIARGAKLAVFDEPEAGIDLWSFSNLIRVFEKMHEEIQGSIVIISHQERILNIADEILIVADGQVTKKGKREEILPEILNSPASACDVLTAKCRN